MEQLIKLKQKLSAKREKESLPLGAKGLSTSAPSSLTSNKTFARPRSKREVHLNYREFSEGEETSGSCAIGTGYTADKGHDRGGEHCS